MVPFDTVVKLLNNSYCCQQYKHIQKHRLTFLQLLKTFLKILATFIDFWGAESKTELSFSLSRTISPKSAFSIISDMCTSS
jgi:hypothetical protein